MTKPTLQELIAKTEYFTIGQESEHDSPKRVVCAVTLHSGLPIMGEYNVPEGSFGEDYNQFAFDNAVQNMKNAGIEFEEPQVIEPEVIPEAVEQQPVVEHDPRIIEGHATSPLQVDPNGHMAGYALYSDGIRGTVGNTLDNAYIPIREIEVLTALLKVPKLKPNVAEAASNKLETLIGQLGQTELPSSEVTKQIEFNSKAIKGLSDKVDSIHAGLQRLRGRATYNRS